MTRARAVPPPGRAVERAAPAAWPCLDALALRRWAAALALLALPAAMADQDDARLAPLFETLRGAGHPVEVERAERAIWDIWLESGREDVDRLMREGLLAMEAGRFEESIAAFGRIVALAPGFAEGWNKRATAYYLAGELEASDRDVERTLALEPRHFGALAGRGLIRLAQGDEPGALAAFEAVLEVHPRAPAARRHVHRLRERLGIEST